MRLPSQSFILFITRFSIIGSPQLGTMMSVHTGSSRMLVFRPSGLRWSWRLHHFLCHHAAAAATVITRGQGPIRVSYDLETRICHPTINVSPRCDWANESTSRTTICYLCDRETVEGGLCWKRQGKSGSRWSFCKRYCCSELFGICGRTVLEFRYHIWSFLGSTQRHCRDYHKLQYLALLV